MKKWVRNNWKGFAAFAAIIVVVALRVLTWPPGNPGIGPATKIVNDLRDLKFATRYFHWDKSRWPEETDLPSLDRYTGRPIVLSDYERVIIGPEFLDDKGIKRVNIGVHLKPANGTEGIRKKLEAKPEDTGLLNGAETSELYRAESMEVFMNMR
jgi:hypothetical protein